MREEARVCLACGEVVRKKVAVNERLMAAPAGVPSWIALDVPSEPEELFYPASRIQRIFAVAVDSLLLGLATFAVTRVVGSDAAEIGDGGKVTFHWGVLIALLAVNAVYLIIFPATKWQGTPGKKLLGIRIVNLENEPISLPQSVLRWACQQVIFSVVIPLAMLVALFGFIAVPVARLILCGDGRSPWDAMAGTKVVE
jgi:uncharacterized RDD family membrane protein YckC